MRHVWKVALAVLILLAISSGLTKLLLMPQDVEFFGRYGFSETMIVVFGAAQMLGGALLLFGKARVPGAAIIAVTFFVSLVFLIQDKNVPFSIASVIALIGLAAIARQPK